MSLTVVDWKQIGEDDLNESDRQAAFRIVTGQNVQELGPFSQPGWIEAVCDWVRRAVPCAEILPDSIRQFNSGARFVLLRFVTREGSAYWLKATGPPNQHEFDLTCYLAKLCPGCLPRLVSTRPEWNAWLMEEAGEPLSDPPSHGSLEDAARTLATLQVETVRCTEPLLAAGACDQRLAILRGHIEQIMDYLIHAMERQISNKVAPLARVRVVELAGVLRDTCARMEALEIPDTLLHNDLNLGNVLWDGRRCVFTDWSEAAVGNPFLSFERLCLLDKDRRTPLRQIYRQSWKGRLSESCIDEAFVYMPLLAILACLYGRGDWIHDEQARTPDFDGYARSLARHMDREAKNPLFLQTLRRRDWMSRYVD